MKRRNLVALSAAAAGATLLIGLIGPSFLSSSTPPTTSAGAGSDARPSVTAAAISHSPLPRANVARGQRWAYDTDFTEAVTLNGENAAPSTDVAIAKRLKASWSLTCTANEGGRVRYRAVLERVSLWINDEPLPAEAQKDFSRTFFFETTTDGRIVSIAFAPETSSDARGVLKALVAASQFVAPSGDAGVDSWMTQEEDPTGEYEARYTREGDDAKVKKARTRYLRITTDKGLRNVSEVGQVDVKDDTKLELAPDGKVMTLASSTATDMFLGQGMPHAHGTAKLTLKLVSATTDVSGLQAMNDEWARLQKGNIASTPGQDDPKTKEALMREAEEGVLKKSTLSDLQRDLAATPPGSSQARSTQMARFQADFRLHPEDTQKAVAYVKTASIADGQAITGALGGAATPEALRALSDISNSRATPAEVRVNAIGALAINGTPSSSSVQSLRSLSNDSDPEIRAASTLALGGAARTLGGSDQGTYDDAVTTLTRGLDAAQSPGEKVLYLRALGNTGDPRVMALAEQYISDPAIEVRVAATVAVRFVPGNLPDQFLARTMQADAEPSVRIQAIATAEGYRKIPSYLQTFGAVMRNDAEALVRRSVLHALNVVRSNPEAMALITAAAQNDASEDNRQMARAIIDAANVVSKN